MFFFRLAGIGLYSSGVVFPAGKVKTFLFAAELVTPPRFFYRKLDSIYPKLINRLNQAFPPYICLLRRTNEDLMLLITIFVW